MDHARQLLEQASQAHRSGQLDVAARLYQQLLALAPDHGEALHLLGVLYHQVGRQDEAVALVERAIRLLPDSWEAYSNLACVYQQQQRLDRAIACYRRALDLSPNQASLWSNLGTALHESGKHEDAQRAYQQAVELQPNLAEAQYNLANLLREQGQTAAAISRYELVLDLAPKHLKAHRNYAHLLVELDQPERAISHYEAICQAEPNRAEAHYHLALALQKCGRLQPAAQYLDRTVQLDPSHAPARLKRAMNMLQAGDWQRGWTEYSWRWKRANIRTARPLPEIPYDGGSLSGQTVLAFAEQGLEAELLFGSCLPDLITESEHAIVECDPRLLNLYRRSFPQATIRARESWNDRRPYRGRIAVARELPVGDLPLRYRRTYSQFPGRNHYLMAGEEHTQRNRDRLALLGGRLRVGIAWIPTGRAAAHNAAMHELRTWLPVLAAPDVAWINLQGGTVLRELAMIERDQRVVIHDWDDCDLIHELDRLAARIAALDLVIAAPGPVAMLAAALGIPTWVVVPAAANWYWPVDCAESPWFPEARLFQTGAGRDASQAITDVGSELKQLLRQQPGMASRPLVSDSNRNVNLIVEGFHEPIAGWTDSDLRTAFERTSQLEQEKRRGEAQEIYRDILARCPHHPDARHRLGVLLMKEEKRDQAIEQFLQARRYAPFNPFIEFHLAVAYSESKRTLEASEHLRIALRLRPDFAEAHMNMGAMLERLGKTDDAIVYCQRAVELNPQNASCHYNLGNSRLHIGDFDEALRCYDRAIEFEPGFDRAQWNRAMALLTTRQWAAGWQAWEAREGAGEVIVDHFDYPVWDGAPLAGKTIFLHAEQGIGDEVMFGSCFPDVIRQAHRCVIGCDPRLERLFQRSFPSATVRGFKRPKDRDWILPEGIDTAISAGSLPGLLRNSETTFPRQRSFLVPDPQRVALWRERYAQLGPGVKVGISWRAGGKSTEQKRRSSELEHWGAIFSVPHVEFVNLQYGNSANDIAYARELFDVEIHDWKDADPLKELDDFAAQVAALDLVISVGNTTIHFAGALGIEAWTMLPHVPGWRYMIEGDELLWYRTVRLFRQHRPNDWRTLSEQIAAMLGDFTRRKLPQSTLARRPARNIIRRDPASTSRGVERQSTGAVPDATLLATNVLSDQPALNTVTETLLSAIKHHQCGDFTAAQAGYEEVLKVRPQDRNGLHLYGTLLDQQGQHARAVELISASLKVDQQQPIAHYNLAGALKALGRSDEAIQHYRRAVELQAKFPEALLNLGVLLRDRGDLNGAMASYHQCLEVRPSYADAHFNLAAILADQGLVEEAIARLKRSVEYRPKFAKAWIKLAGLLQQCGRVREADECLAQVGRLHGHTANGPIPRPHGPAADATGMSDQLDGTSHRTERMVP